MPKKKKKLGRVTESKVRSGSTPVSKPQIVLTVIPEAATKGRSVLAMLGEETIVMRGTGSNDFVCGECGVTILENIDGPEVKNLVFKCAACGAFNEKF